MILVSGAGGFIGRAVLEALGADGRGVPHGAITEPGLLEGIDAVVHCGRHPALGSQDWRLEDDAEPRVACACAEAQVPLVSLGTRKVYAPSDAPLAEDAAIAPSDRYGLQKLELEHCLTERLGPLLTRLRIANVFGDERGRKGFMGTMLRGLGEEGTIRFDMSPFTVRDFIPLTAAARAIAALARHPPGGIVNIGSGVALPTGRLALALIEGHGRGNLVITDVREHDAFTLEVTRMRELTGVVVSAEDILETARAIGRRCAAASA